jgi:multidrug transporter EmrE-like cation transporter
MKIKLFNILTLSLALSSVFLSSTILLTNESNAPFSTATSLYLSLGSVLIAVIQINKFKQKLFLSILIMVLLAILVLVIEQAGKLQ